MRELYLPPIHGGLVPADTGYEEDDDEDDMADGMDGLGLGLDTGATVTPDGETDDLDGSDSGEEDSEAPHLDPFEREWAEKWLNGVVRRAQGWLEDNESSDDVGMTRDMERVLRDTTAVLAIMAGTSGMPSCYKP